MTNIYADNSEYAVSSWLLDKYPVGQAPAMLAKQGFRNVTLGANTVHLDPQVSPDVPAIRKTLREQALSVHSVHAPFRHVAFPHPQDALAFAAYRMELWKETARYCSELESGIMVVHALDRREYNSMAEEYQKIGETLQEISTYAGKLGVTIALENITGSQTPEVRKKEFACTLENQARLYRDAGVKFCLDIGHAPLSGMDPFTEADAAGWDLITFHIHNNDGTRDAHALPNNGIIDWSALRAHIRALGFGGIFVLEVFGGEQPEAVLDRLANLFAE